MYSSWGAPLCQRKQLCNVPCPLTLEGLNLWVCENDPDDALKCDRKCWDWVFLQSSTNATMLFWLHSFFILKDCFHSYDRINWINKLTWKDITVSNRFTLSIYVTGSETKEQQRQCTPGWNSGCVWTRTSSIVLTLLLSVPRHPTCTFARVITTEANRGRHKYGS